MSGYRRYRSRYGYRRRRYGYGYRRYGMSTARKANIAYRSTRKMVKRQEVKSFNYQLGETSPNDVFIKLASVIRGTGDSDRIGNTITPTSLRIRLRLYGEDASGGPISGNWTQLFRIIVVVWKNIGNPALSNILETTNPGLYQLTSLKNVDEKYNSKILYDKVHKLDSQMQQKYVNINIKKALRRYPITFDSGESSVAYKMNGIGMFILSPGGQQSITGSFYYTLTSKLNYKDS